jgi:hypothetical protein
MSKREPLENLIFAVCVGLSVAALALLALVVLGVVFLVEHL